jgi:hypothetical protein
LFGAVKGNRFKNADLVFMAKNAAMRRRRFHPLWHGLIESNGRRARKASCRPHAAGMAAIR